MRESKVEAHLKARVKALGGETRKLSWIGRRSAPDILVMFPYPVEPSKDRGWDKPVFRPQQQGFVRGSHFMVECKRPGKDATEAQAREHERLRAAGFVVLVLDTIEKVDEVFG